MRKSRIPPSLFLLNQQSLSGWLAISVSEGFDPITQKPDPIRGGFTCIYHPHWILQGFSISNHPHQNQQSPLSDLCLFLSWFFFPFIIILNCTTFWHFVASFQHFCWNYNYCKLYSFFSSQLNSDVFHNN